MAKLRKTPKKIFAAAAAALAFFIAGAAFYNRQPVLIVSDRQFNLIYGERRALITRLVTQARLFRPVKQALIGENAGADLVSLAAQSAAKAPYCALFPYRYHEGAVYYAREMPHIPVAVLGGAGQKAPDGVAFITTDEETDLYRAGRCAAILVQPAADSPAVDALVETKNRIMVLQRKTLAADQRQIFLQGAQDEGFTGMPAYLTPNSAYRSAGETTVVVMFGNGTGFFEENKDASVILFSWMDPGATSSWVKMVFDDSLWALAIPAVEMARKGESGVLPSQPRLLDGRVESRDIRRRLKKAAR
ncbi:MAG: hypothetical protein LBF60_03750 [Treponema sp.]|jgi:hypothetical protein|nr:hypothetical protein [Treponema sp.]